MRAVGVILILFACLLIDNAYRRYLERRVRVLEEMCELFTTICNRLPEGVRPLSSLVVGLELCELSKCGFLNALLVGDSPLAAYKKAAPELGLGESVDTRVTDFFEYGVRGTAAKAEQCAKSVLAALEKERGSVKENTDLRLKLLRVVLLSVGLGLGISVI